MHLDSGIEEYYDRRQRQLNAAWLDYQHAEAVRRDMVAYFRTTRKMHDEGQASDSVVQEAAVQMMQAGRAVDEAWKVYASIRDSRPGPE